MYAILTEGCGYVGVDQIMAENICFNLMQSGIRILDIMRYRDA